MRDDGNHAITEEWLKYIGFTGGRNKHGPSCGRTWCKDGLRLECYLLANCDLVVWCDLERGDVYKLQWQILHLCKKHNVTCNGITEDVCEVLCN